MELCKRETTYIRDGNEGNYEVECQRPMFQFYIIQCQTNASNVRISSGGNLAIGKDLLEALTQLCEGLVHLIS